ncbi:MAG: glycosyltransferase [Candidatus Riflebacteria bacterium]|nr:glycosyltransferase [Candidatus Riflebacteria bacterium]
MPSADRISIIIPTLDEEECLGRTLESSMGATCVERIVVDGGSSDGTVRIARANGCRVLVAPPGRDAATGDVSGRRL